MECPGSASLSALHALTIVPSGWGRARGLSPRDSPELAGSQGRKRLGRGSIFHRAGSRRACSKPDCTRPQVWELLRQDGGACRRPLAHSTAPRGGGSNCARSLVLAGYQPPGLPRCSASPLLSGSGTASAQGQGQSVLPSSLCRDCGSGVCGGPGL